MNRPVRQRVSARDQDRSAAVTRVAVRPGVAMVPCLRVDTFRRSADPSVAPTASHFRGADSKHGPGSQLLLRHS
ncbi:hypothetical protein E1258_07920 [Micromonospora sp. KC207]|nr:hypothetical protein E1258_07920 [Micromonospora sp. KC207]